MKHRIFYGILMLILLLLETALPVSFFTTASPNLLLCAVLCAALFHGKRAGMAAGIFGGLLTDIASGGIFGFYALLYMLLGYAGGCFTKVFFENRFRIPVVFAFLGDIAFNIMIYLTRFFLRGRLAIGRYFLTIILPGAVMTAVGMLVLYAIVYLFETRLLREEEAERRKTWLKD